MGNKVRMIDIANKLGISKATVSKALSSATDVNEKTRESVLACASELGYYVKIDRMVRDKNIIVFVYGVQYGNVNQFGYEIILGIQAAANEINWGVKIINISDVELYNGEYYKNLENSVYEGCYFVGFRPHENFLEKINGTDLPLVVLDNDVDYLYAARVGSDNNLGINLIVKHLIDNGHKNIGFLGGEEDSVVTTERENAYKSAMLKNGIDNSCINIRYGHFSGYKIKRQVLALAREKVSAIVCISDKVAIATIDILKEQGFRVPEDISVTGFDNLPESAHSEPPLTTVSQNRLHIGKTAFKVLQLMKSGIKVSEIVLKPELVKRSSVKNLNEK